MKRLVFVALLLPITAFADHHRSHAMLRLNNMQSHADAALAGIEAYAAGTVLTEFQQRRVGTVQTYLKAVKERSERAKDGLQNNTYTLDEVRRFITQPARKENGVMAVNSASKRMHAIGTLIIDFLPLNNGMMTEWGTFTFHFGVLWYELDEASWHITDAIREEIYEDPVFICSGPNNHCE